jgi:curli biogenesis system outer membrane secretion channel CsgG
LNLAVNDFRADGGSASDAAVCSTLLRSALVGTGAFNVVEKERMSAVLEEQASQQTGCTMQECAVKLGKLLNVKRFVVGNFGMLLGNYFLNVRAIDVETGRITFSESVKGQNADDLRRGLEAMAVRMARGPI